MVSVMNSALAPLKLLVLGAGAVVQEYYIPALQVLGLLPYVTIADLSADSLAKIKSTYPEIHTQQTDFRYLLEAEDSAKLFDAVLVALPNALHEVASLLALNLQFHVLCE